MGPRSPSSSWALGRTAPISAAKAFHLHPAARILLLEAGPLPGLRARAEPRQPRAQRGGADPAGERSGRRARARSGECRGGATSTFRAWPTAVAGSRCTGAAGARDSPPRIWRRGRRGCGPVPRTRTTPTSRARPASCLPRTSSPASCSRSCGRDRSRSPPGVANLDVGLAGGPIEEAPLAVQGDSPISGLFSFDKFSSLPILTQAIRADIGQLGRQRSRAPAVPGAPGPRRAAARRSRAAHTIEVEVGGVRRFLSIGAADGGARRERDRDDPAGAGFVPDPADGTQPHGARPERLHRADSAQCAAARSRSMCRRRRCWYAAGPPGHPSTCS